MSSFIYFRRYFISFISTLPLLLIATIVAQSVEIICSGKKFSPTVAINNNYNDDQLSRL